MRLLGWIRSPLPQQTGKQAGSGSARDRIAVVSAFLTVIAVGSVFVLSKGTQFLMPGPLASAHGAIERCDTCHTKSGSGKLRWIHGLVAGDPLADSKACLTCHKMPDTAFNAHSAPADVLKQSTERLTKIAAGLPAPQSARAQGFAFPTHEIVARGLYCATCHQEHQGTNFNLNKISNEQCRSCHVVKFESFDGDHPKFDNYPFKRRTRIVYDHAAHFGKHYPDVAKKDPAKRIPETCAACHNSRDDKSNMGVAPFEQTCATCHLDQITGKERVSGPKGIAFLAVPGLDLQAMKEKNAALGEWPDESDAALTPFMKVMIGRNERGRALIKTVDSLNLQDLAQASDDQIKAVTDLAWEIKSLFYSLISGKASDVLGDLNIGHGAKLSANLVSDLTASIPRDVVITAQKQWLPNLAAEMANGPGTSAQQQDGWSAVTTDPATASAEPAAAGSAAPEQAFQPEAEQVPTKRGRPATVGEGAKKSNRDPPPCVLRVLGQCLVSKAQEGKSEAAQSEGVAAPADTSNAKSELPGAMRAGLTDAATAAEPKVVAGNSGVENPKPQRPQVKATDQTDDLLFPTEDEQREINARNKNAGTAGQPIAPAGAAADGDIAPSSPRTTAAPVTSIESGVDPESWAEYGGWYQQDYAIFYRPGGHEDKFITSWLTLTGPQTHKGDTSPPAAVFDFLTSKDAQGSCTKCHSVDDIQGQGRSVNFSPLSVDRKQGRFTRFIHEPHFGIIGNRGCLTCHELEKYPSGEAAAKTDGAKAKSDAAVSADTAQEVSPYLKRYEQSNPHNFASEFSAVKRDLCQNCHTISKARQDCLTCHKYHVNDVITPITNTKLPIE